MRKHHLAALLLLLASAGAVGLFTVGFLLPAQLLYTVALLGLFALTKIIGHSFQQWSALLVSCGLGYVLGDWWLSLAFVCAYLSLNIRGFVFKERIYTYAHFLEPLLACTSLAVFLATNLLHKSSWQAWTLPVPGILIGLIFSFMNYVDRKKITAMLEMGVIEPGTPAPDFTLPDQDGNPVTLSDYFGKRDVLLIFVRGDWCPGCHIMLRLYEREREKFQQKNIMLFAIGPDPVGVNRAMVEKLGVDFAVLSDDKMEVSKKFCVRVQEDAPGAKFEAGIPLPASFLVDKKGTVRYTSRADRAGEFLRPDVIFDVLAKI